jgi:superfamily II DNA or RNA helicase
LLDEVLKFAKTRHHEIEIDQSLRNCNDYTFGQITEFVNLLKLQGRGNPIEVRKYQYEAIHKAISTNRSLLISPTSSGKSLIIYSIIRWHIQMGRKIMIVVPSTMLVNQLFSDFEDYSTANSFTVEDNISVLYSGKERVFDKPVVISTWQSMAAMMKNDKNKFQELVGRTEVGVWDEAHTAKASVVLGVMEKFINTKFRIGTTGTIDDKKVNTLSLVGLLGPVYKVISTKELMDAGQVVNLKINCIVLKYPEHICKAYKGMDYTEEIKFLVGYENRNRFIAKLVTSIKGNTLVLQNFVEKHGAILVRYIEELTDRKVYFIHGGVDTEDRESIRKVLDTEKDVIIVATSSLMSTGVNIPSIENIVFAIPTKSSIRVRQSIGRGLRLKDGKTHCTLWDIADDLSYKKYTNTTMHHLEERIGIYSKEQFEYKITKLPIQ